MISIIYNTLDKTHYKAVVFESASSINMRVLEHHIKSRTTVYLLEPFVSFHARKGPFHGFSGSLPDGIKKLLRKKDIALITAESIEVKTIYRQAADRAVDIIESVFDAYKKDCGELLECVANTLNSPTAVNAFKKSLCHKLAEFYSVNILLDRIEKHLGSGPVLVYPDTNVHTYLYLKNLLAISRQDFFKHPDIRFPVELKWIAFIENFKEYAVIMSRLSAQTLVSGLLRIFRSSGRKNKIHYSYGISVISPVRQLSNNRRGPDFIVDNVNIHEGNVVYLPLSDLTADQNKTLSKLPGEIFQPPKAGRCFSYFSEWKRLLLLVSKKNFFLKGEEINTACNVFFSYFRWLKVLERIEFQHFITHCDFGINHIGRNIALNQAGIQTWYFTDSMNLGGIYQTEATTLRHPFWTYLHYDHFVTWNDVIATFFKSHPGSFNNSHVVGCLWSGNQERTSVQSLKNDGSHFILSAYDSTYTLNAAGSYAEGISFAKDLLKLADDFSDIHIFFKEKKPRDLHNIFDPNLGPDLLKVYRNNIPVDHAIQPACLR